MNNHTAEVEILLQAARAVLANRPFQETARVIFDQARTITGATAGYVALLDAAGHENEVLFLEAGAARCTVDPSLPMPIRGLRAVAYRTGEPAWHNDFLHSEWAALMPSGHAPLRNVLFAPLNLDGRTVGIMGLANKPGDFTGDDARIAGALGDLAAVALRNARNLDNLERTVTELAHALAEVKTLRGFLPICAYCRKVRDDDGYWEGLEAYVQKHSGATFSHGLCPSCADRFDTLLDEHDQK